MRTNLALVGVLISGSLHYLCAVQPDTRFDGVWVGTETTRPHVAMPVAPNSGAGSGTASLTESVTQKRSAKIIIAKGGTMLAVAEGKCPGRYANVRKSGDSIVFEAGDCKLHVTLSGDGRTLTENGTAMQAMSTGTGMALYTKMVPVEVLGTFHREGR